MTHTVVHDGGLQSHHTENHMTHTDVQDGGQQSHHMTHTVVHDGGQQSHHMENHMTHTPVVHYDNCPVDLIWCIESRRLS